jgi:hypothetical protein
MEDDRQNPTLHLEKTPLDRRASKLSPKGRSPGLGGDHFSEVMKCTRQNERVVLYFRNFELCLPVGYPRWKVCGCTIGGLPLTMAILVGVLAGWMIVGE